MLIFLSVFFLLNNSELNSQTNRKNEFAKKDKIEINKQIEYANKLIWHFNNNLKTLNYYQSDLISWFEDSKRETIDISNFYFSGFIGEKQKINKEGFSDKNNLFNYNFHLDRMEKQILLFDLLCKRLEKLEFLDSKIFRENVYEIFRSFQKQSVDIAEISYDFSRACAISFKNEKHPEQLKLLKEIISQAKNVILSLRNDNKSQAKDYLSMLDKSLLKYKSNINYMELNLVSETKLNISELKLVSENIFNKAFLISSWAEQYLQASFSPKGMNNLLQKAISDFNEAEGKMGCASSFNTLLEESNNNYMFFLEEPNTIYAEKITAVPLEKNSIIVDNVNNKGETKIEEKVEPEIIEKEEIIKPIYTESPKEEKFDELDDNSLAGALPNNLIILMDISVSMKKSGKLPVLKKSIKHILRIMRDEDRISLIAYSGQAKVLVSGAEKKDVTKIIKILLDLQSSGGADLENALDSAYLIGKENFIANGNNKIIIASDGVFGVTYSIKNLVQEKTNDGFSLSVFQYNNADETNNTKSLKFLSKIGNGSFRTIKSDDEAISVLMQEIKKKL